MVRALVIAALFVAFVAGIWALQAADERREKRARRQREESSVRLDDDAEMRAAA